MRKKRSRTLLHILTAAIVIFIIGIVFLPTRTFPLNIRDTTKISKEKISKVATQTTGTLKETGTGLIKQMGSSIKDAAGEVVKKVFLATDDTIRQGLDTIGHSLSVRPSSARGASGAKIFIDAESPDSPADISVFASVKKNSPMDFLISSSKNQVISYAVSWGDGSQDSGYAKPGTSLSHIWPVEGSYEVRFTVEADGKKKDGTFYVHVGK